MNIVCDVDLTLVRSDIAWCDYLNSQYFNLYDNRESFLVPEQGKVIEYDMTKYFPDADYSFWSKPDLYQPLSPIEGSVETLKHYSKQGARIIFASYCKKGHFGSKYDWLEEHFPFMDGFMATKEKQYITADVFIDDRNDMLNARYEEDLKCRLIKYQTHYTQDVELIDPKSVFLAKDWNDVKFLIGV